MSGERRAGSTLLEMEIREQGEVLERRAGGGIHRSAEAARLLRDTDSDYLVLAARGSSAHAARYAQYALGRGARLSTALAAPSLYRHPARAPKLARAAVLGISQSGQSPDIVSVLDAARAQGRPTIAITNSEDSPLADVADILIPLLTGPERSVAATKTYLATLQAIEQLLDGLNPSSERREWLARLPSLVHGMAEVLLANRAMFDPLVHATLLTIVGRGFDLATAMESALKIRELSAIPAEAFSPPDLLHGPVASLTHSSHLWLVSTGDPPDQSAREILQRARVESLRTILVSSRTEPTSPDQVVIEIPAAPPPWLRSILAVIPGQVAGFRLGECRDVDIDRPHGLRKVTLTR
jgi:glutamine---fructose-6-phosphate transaminase (isomerizing)